MPTYAETDNGLMIPRSLNGHGSTAGLAAMLELYESRLGELELQLAEQGWGRLDSEAGREFSRDALGRIVELARVMYLKNPLVNRAVEIGALYVWGQDLARNADDEDVRLVLDRFWIENHFTLTGQQASRLLEVELQVTGNVFIALFPDAITGSVKVRGVPMEEVQQIITNPEDRAEVWYYRRSWSQEKLSDGSTAQHTALYPDWHYSPENKPASISISGRGDVEIRWESPLLHVKSGAFAHWRWGVPEVYPALDWAKAYKELLENDATRSRALARFAWNIVSTGGAQGVQAAKSLFGTTLSRDTLETNPPPVTGSAYIRDKSLAGAEPIRIAGAMLDPDHSRPARLMAAAALGIPDHFFDPDQANYATASTLDRPTELRFSERRQMWKDTLGDLCQWVIDADLAATRGLLPKTIGDDERQIELSWPSLLERETKDVVAAIVAAATLDGKASANTMAPETVSRLLLSAIGVDDVDGEIEKVLAGADSAVPQAEAFVEALKALRETLRANAH